MPYYNPDVVQLSSSSTSSSEGAYDYEALKPQPKNNWTIEQRTTLDLLTTFYQHDWEVFAMVFNSLYQSQLPLLKGLTIQKLRTQHSFMKWYKPAFDRKAAQMKLQSMNPSSSLKFSDSEMRVSLEAKARSFGSVLKRKSLDGKLSSDRQAVIHRILKRKRTLVETDDGRTDFASSSESDGEASRRPKHKKRYKNFLVETPSRKVSSRRDSGLFTPPESTKLQRKLDSTVDKRLAPLGFRAFNADSQGLNSVEGFVAGAFVKTTTLTPCPDLESAEYQEEAVHHINKFDSTRPSKFISFTKNPMRAFHGRPPLKDAPVGSCFTDFEDNRLTSDTLVALQKAPNSFIAVIDLQEADRFGNVQKAKDLRFKMHATFSPSEYIIWGGVKPSAIISIVPLARIVANMPIMPDDKDPFSFQTLKAKRFLAKARPIVQSVPLPMGFDSGRAVGEMMKLLDVPVNRVIQVVWAIVNDYKFKGHKKGQWQDNPDFKAGVEEGFCSEPYDSTIYEEPIQTGENVVGAARDQELDQAAPLSVKDNPENPASLEVEQWLHGSWSRIQPKSGELPVLANEEEFNDGFLAEMLEFAGLPEENAAQEGADHQIVNQSRGLTDHGDEEQQQVQETAGGSKNDYEYCWTGL